MGAVRARAAVEVFSKILLETDRAFDIFLPSLSGGVHALKSLFNVQVGADFLNLWADWSDWETKASYDFDTFRRFVLAYKEIINRARESFLPSWSTPNVEELLTHPW